MRRWFLFVEFAIFIAPALAACEVSWGRSLQNPTVYSTNRRFTAILRVHEKIPDFGRRRTSLILHDPVPNWRSVPVAVYDRRERINEFHVDIGLVNDLLVSSSGEYVVGILRTKRYPCPDPPRLPNDQIATIYRADGTLVGIVRLAEVVAEFAPSADEPHGPALDYSLRTERDGREVLVIGHQGVSRRVLLATAAMLDRDGS